MNLNPTGQIPILLSVCGFMLTLLGADVREPFVGNFPVDSVIHLRKNTNKNQVHYEVRVDELCRPLLKNPVHGYWRVLETGKNEVAELAFWEQPGYGVRQPKSVHHEETGGHFNFRIRGVSERLIAIETFSRDGACRARAYTEIHNARAIFAYIEIEVSGWANVHQVEIFGYSLEGEPVSEVTYRDD